MTESVGTTPSIPLSEIRLDTVTTDAPAAAPGEVKPPPSTLSGLLIGLVYVAAGAPDRRWFAVAGAHGIELVDLRGLHWPAELVERTLGPLDVVQS